MKADILQHLDAPHELEKLYRNNSQSFQKAFNDLYPEIEGHVAARFWNERLNYGKEELSWGSAKDIWFVIFASLIAWLLIKIPDFTAINSAFYYSRNIGFFVFPFLSIYFIWKHALHLKFIWFTVATTIISGIYINVLPTSNSSDTLILACLHLPIFLWFVLGINFTGQHLMRDENRIQFLSYNGDLLVMMALILIAGGIMTGITIGLFSLIEIEIEDIYFLYVVKLGLAATPLLATFLIRSNPQLVGKVSPVIAKVFTPIVLIMLTIYLVAVMITGKDPYNDREFLIVFNALLLGVMALILFSIAETSKNTLHRFTVGMLFTLSIITLIINSIALSAILFRISEWGLTPNRLAVLGSNVLILTHLILVAFQLFRVIKNNLGTESVNHAMASFLPAYLIWAFLVTFLFPLLFGFQ